MIQIIDGSRYPSSLQANVAALQGAGEYWLAIHLFDTDAALDDHDHGTIDFAFKAAAILVDILQDPNNFLKVLCWILHSRTSPQLVFPIQRYTHLVFAVLYGS